MFGNTKTPQPVDLVAIENTFIEGTLVLKGQTLEAVAADLAIELAGSGKVRPVADPDEFKKLKAAFARAQKAEAEAAKGDTQGDGAQTNIQA